MNMIARNLWMCTFVLSTLVYAMEKPTPAQFSTIKHLTECIHKKRTYRTAFNSGDSIQVPLIKKYGPSIGNKRTYVIHLEHLGLSDLSDITAFTELTGFDYKIWSTLLLNNNKLTSCAALAKLPSNSMLEHIDLSNNQITSVDAQTATAIVSLFPSLKSINFSGNPLTLTLNLLPPELKPYVTTSGQQEEYSKKAKLNRQNSKPKEKKAVAHYLTGERDRSQNNY